MVQMGPACGSGSERQVSGSQYAYSGLQPGTRYYWRVRTKNACGVYGSYSACRSFTTATNLLSKAIGPTMLLFDNKEVTIRWTPPVDCTAVTFHVYRAEKGLDRIRLSGDIVRTGVEGEGTYEFKDHGVDVSRTYCYWVEAISSLGESEMKEIGEVTISGVIPARMVLHQNRPNPFNPSTVIEFELPSCEHVRLCIYDASGKAIRALLDSDMSSGSHHVTWDGLNDNGEPVASGTYVCHLSTMEEARTTKITLMR